MPVDLRRSIDSGTTIPNAYRLPSPNYVRTDASSDATSNVQLGFMLAFLAWFARKRECWLCAA